MSVPDPLIFYDDIAVDLIAAPKILSGETPSTNFIFSLLSLMPRGTAAQPLASLSLSCAGNSKSIFGNVRADCSSIICS